VIFVTKNREPAKGGPTFVIPELPAPPRTDDSWSEDLQQVYSKKIDPLVAEKDKHHRGVKGASMLLNLKYFSISHVVVDYMHAVLLGAVKHHMELILDSTRDKIWVGLGKNRIGRQHIIAANDNRIARIQSNTSIIRELRPLKDFKYWKASEMRSWLLFYCIPCLIGILKPKYVIHLAMLSQATFLLLQKKVTKEEIEEAKRLFVTYTFYFQIYFGEENMRYCIHLLSHIDQCVYSFGPMWTHSRLPYESKNKYIIEFAKAPFL